MQGSNPLSSNSKQITEFREIDEQENNEIEITTTRGKSCIAFIEQLIMVLAINMPKYLIKNHSG